MDNTKKISEKLSPLERNIIPFLNLKVEEIEKKSGLDNTSVRRALRTEVLSRPDFFSISSTFKFKKGIIFLSNGDSFSLIFFVLSILFDRLYGLKSLFY